MSTYLEFMYKINEMDTVSAKLIKLGMTGNKNDLEIARLGITSLMAENNDPSSKHQFEGVVSIVIVFLISMLSQENSYRTIALRFYILDLIEKDSLKTFPFVEFETVIKIFGIGGLLCKTTQTEEISESVESTQPTDDVVKDTTDSTDTTDNIV